MSALVNDLAHDCVMNAVRNGDDVRGGLGIILWTLAVMLFGFVALASLCGCAYKGGKIIDGTNLAVGITVPGTEFTINALDYVGGLRVAGQDRTIITVTNDVDETNRYFGIIETSRHSKMSAKIEPMELSDTVQQR